MFVCIATSVFILLDKKQPFITKQSSPFFIIDLGLCVLKLFPNDKICIASKSEVFPDPFFPQITVIPLEKLISFLSWFLNDSIERFDMAKNKPKNSF